MSANPAYKTILSCNIMFMKDIIMSRGGSSLLVLLSQEFNDEVIKLHARRACESTPKAALIQLGVWGALGGPQWGLGWNPRNKRKFRGFEL